MGLLLIETQVHDLLYVYEFFHYIVKIQICLQFSKVFVDFVKDISIGLLLLLKLMIRLQALILVTKVVKKALDEFVFNDPLMEKIFPNSVKLEFARLIGAIDGLLEKEPEFFKLLETALKLLVVFKNVVKNLFVFHLPVDESLELLAGLFNILPRGISTLFPQIVIIYRVVQVHLLLLFICVI